MSRQFAVYQINAQPQFFNETQWLKTTYNAGIATAMLVQHVVQRDIREQTSGTDDFQGIVVHLYLYTASRQAVVSVGHSIDQSFPHDTQRVLGLIDPRQSLHHRLLVHLLTHDVVRFRNDVGQVFDDLLPTGIPMEAASLQLVS